MKEYRIFGPPGTGKTTTLSRQIGRAVQKFGAYGVAVCSFTRAAVRELISRDLPINEENIGTLHALAYRAIGRPPVAESPKALKEFTQAHPEWRLDQGSREDLDDSHPSETDNSLAELSFLRSRLVAPEFWPDRVRRFSLVWEGWKHDTGMVDYCDMIEQATDLTLPSLVKVLFVDEAQDLKPLEMRLVRRWGEYLDYFVVVGDDDQSLYRWAGSDPAVLQKPELPGDQIRVLGQSWRVPGVIWDKAQRLIGTIPASHRQQKNCAPREGDGHLEYVPLTVEDGSLVDMAEASEGTALFLTTCAYQLMPLISELKRRGVPFSNPYRRRNRAWNPLHVSRNREERIATVDRIRAWLAGGNEDREHRTWTREEIGLWLGLVNRDKAHVPRGFGKRFLEVPEGVPLSPVNVEYLIGEEAADALDALENRGQWLLEHLKKGFSQVDYLLRALPRHNGEEPKIRVGTIHSVKGGEADTVFLFPDISSKGLMSWYENAGGYHDLVRTFYVGMTRARESLYLCEPRSPKLSFPI